ncbi:zinc-dependent alcohol dehydrogenase [Salinarimonas sp. NSM]|uniref:zinc-dependent alcohol dehydrogenase n=1 Tax=Salinarimonas sp. NSM TaxID=3458003 RepID=UPI004035A388
MKAARFLAPWTLALGDVPDPAAPGPGEVMVRVRATGICGTDIGILSGAYAAQAGVVLGHESTGDVVAAGEGVGSVAVGDRVVIDPTFHCGFCRMCRTNRQNHCERKHGTEAGVSRDGTFAELYACDERFVHRLPDGLSYEAGALTEPLGCALTGVARLDLHLGHRVVVVGAGPLGVLYAHALASRGVRGRLVERSDARRALAADVLPAGWRLAASLDEIAAAYAPDPTPIDVAVDTTSVMVEPLVALMARGGQVLAIGLRPHAVAIDAGAVADRSLAVLGSIDTLENAFAQALALLASGAVPAEALVTHRLPLSRLPEAVALLGCDIADRRLAPPGAALKVMIDPSAGEDAR